MQPRLPDWLIYGAVTCALLLVAVSRQERADAPPPPPPMAEADDPLVADTAPFEPGVVVRVPDRQSPGSGTAFSIGDGGVWLTARHVVDGCGRTAVLVSEGRGVAARVSIDPAGEAAVLTTEGGAEALPLALDEPMRRGMLAYHPGFPQGSPGEAASRLLGRETLVVEGRGARREPVLVWAEIGRTKGLHGTLAGLSGAPALDEFGRVVGVTIAESPRRGRIYTTAPETVLNAIAASRRDASLTALGEPISSANYGRVADALRRDLRVAEVVCLPA